MKALTLHQPWAWTIAAGHKAIENRDWAPTWYRGPLAIHAGKHLDSSAETDVYISTRLDPAKPLPPKWWLRRGVLPAGAIVAVADLGRICTDIDRAGGRGCDCGQWAARGARCHWRLANVRQLAEPVPCRGGQGLWTVPADVEHLVLERSA